MNRRLRNLTLAVAAATVLAACGGSDEGQSDEAKPYVDVMTESMSDGDSPMTEKQARCFGENFVTIVGLDKIEEVGSPEEFADETSGGDFEDLDLSEDQGNEIYDQYDECGVNMREALLEDLADDDSMDDQTKQCMDEAITDDTLRDFYVTMIVHGEDAATGEEGDAPELMSELMSCMMSNIDLDELDTDGAEG